MKRKFITYLLVATVLTAAGVANFSMDAYAITQDEGAAYAKYISSLVSQGYSKEDIRAYLHSHGDGSIATAMKILPEAVANGSLKNAGGAASTPAPSQETPAETPKEEKPAPEHKHEYTANLTTNPTCTEEGVMTYTCSCGDSYTEAYPKLEHQYEGKVTREPNCAVEGEMTYTCTLCGDSYTEPIEVIAHTPGAAQTTVEPTCTKEGEKVVKCTVCGAVISTESIPMAEHEEGLTKITVPERLLKDGVKETHCRNCDILLRSESVPAILGWHHFIPLCVVAAILLYVVIYVAVAFHKDKKNKKNKE